MTSVWMCPDICQIKANTGDTADLCTQPATCSVLSTLDDLRSQWTYLGRTCCVHARRFSRVSTLTTLNRWLRAKLIICARSNILRFPCILCDLCSFKRFLWNRLSKRGIIHGIPLKLHNLKWNGTEGLIFICGQSRASDGPTKTI